MKVQRARRFFTLVLLLSLWISSAEAMRITLCPAKWPDDWPVNLEPFRDQALTVYNSGASVLTKVQQDYHEIPLYSRSEFDQFWPALLEVRSEGTPISVGRLPRYPINAKKKRVALVRISVPPAGVSIYPPMRDEANNPISSERARLYSRHYHPSKELTDEELAVLKPDEIVGGLTIDREARSKLPNEGIIKGPSPPWPMSILEDDGAPAACVYPQWTDSGRVEWKRCGEDHPGDCVRTRVEIKIQIDEDVIDIDELSLPNDAELVDKLQSGL